MLSAIDFPLLTTEQLEHRVYAGSFCADLVADGADDQTWIIDVDPTGVQARADYERAARDACDGCQVIGECLEWAIRTYNRHHIYGGTAPWEREEMIRARRRSASDTALSAPAPPAATSTRAARGGAAAASGGRG